MTILEYIQQNPDATDAEAAAALSETTYAKVQLATLAAWLTLSGRMARFRDATTAETIPKPYRDAIQDLVDAINNPKLENLDLTIDEIRARWLGGGQVLAGYGVISADEAAELAAMGRTITVVTEQDVQDARLQIAQDTLRQQWANVYNAGVSAIDAGTMTTITQLRTVK